MNKIPASTGWLWIKQGFALFMKQPGGLTMLVIAYSFLMQVLSIVPWVGPVAAMILTPVFCIGFMRAYQGVEKQQRVTLHVLFEGFRSPALPRLITLGALYLAAMAIMMGIFALNMGDVALQVQQQKITPDAALKQVNFGALFFWLLVIGVPAGMAYLLSPMLIYWQQMKVGKALFYSFFTIWRSFRAYLVFQLCWVMIFMITVQVLAYVFGQNATQLLVRALLFPVALVLYQCASYACYKHFFGAPSDQPVAPEQTIE
ncbi:BPSS1780 family membrane protein [Pseudoduganella ginsengisoli]|uniref:DUF2189 domain-containing protein n=1 Tax=Pseudoduganella ginsengisoli TaxID=1462440 RepID=A0A6L6PXS3_9BURK|nr:BPSS1780 family membrane protein [Pseudoduganella ginsengisoli]MTW01979.1 hypothetical protein [Pseudoduganella ginsengisoli]